MSILWTIFMLFEGKNQKKKKKRKEKERMEMTEHLV
jgi:hypothetical protein